MGCVLYSPCGGYGAARGTGLDVAGLPTEQDLVEKSPKPTLNQH